MSEIGKGTNLITVIIATYNRGYCINVALDSLVAQTCQKFECIVVDDGSTDNTKEVVEHYIRDHKLDIRYVYKENGGVHTAKNYGIQLTRTEFFITLDSDDTYEKTAIQTLYETWDALNEIEKRKYSCGIVGLVKNSVNNEIIGGKFPANINSCRKKKYLKYLKAGERIHMLKTSVFQEIPFVEADGLKFIPEGTNAEENLYPYRQFAINKVLRVYKTDSIDSICHSNYTREKCFTAYFSHKYKINHYYPSKLETVTWQICSYIFIVRFGLNLGMGLKEILNDIERKINKCLVILLSPIGFVYYICAKKPDDAEI